MTKPDIYFIDKTILINDELRLALCGLRDTYGDATLRSRALKGWTGADVEWLLKLPPIYRFSGKPVFHLSPDDLLKHSRTQITVMLKCAIVTNMPELSSARAKGEFLAWDDHYVGVLMARAAGFPQMGLPVAAL